MPKSIVFCADGTWNGPSEPDGDDKTAPPTNVFSMYLALAGRDTPGTTQLEKEQERELVQDGVTLQVAKYLHGVGDSDNFLVKALGGSIGAGLITRIVRGYTFISRNYRNGDKVFIIGFSRGAYTARALAGLIANQGLLDAAGLGLTERNKEQAYQWGAATWYRYRREAAATAHPDWLGRLEDITLMLPGFLTRPPPGGSYIPVTIEAVGVWDTVGALGIPEFTVQSARVDVLQFADTNLSDSVRHGFHAVAVDEQRGDFTPTLWQPRDGIVQELFPGAHTDVGGGDPSLESALSHCALVWMIDHLRPLGVLFADHEEWTPAPDPCGPLHEPYKILPWSLLLHALRRFPAGSAYSDCLRKRLQNMMPKYAPKNLP